MFLRNTAKGARGILLRNGGTLLVESGATVSVASAAITAMPKGLEKVDSPSASPDDGEKVEPGPLDHSIDDLVVHLAGVTDPDEVQRLIDAETAGKSRKGALEALEARRDELLAA